jgi:hypothetical protein
MLFWEMVDVLSESYLGFMRTPEEVIKNNMDKSVKEGGDAWDMQDT